MNYLKIKLTLSLFTALVSCTTLADKTNITEPTQLLWGDTHLHTNNSFDAYLFGNYTGDPDTAYRWAKGQPVIHPKTKARIQINTPLDFLVVADHAELLGIMKALDNDTAQLSEMGLIDSFKRWYAIRAIKNSLHGGDGGDLYKKLLKKEAVNYGGDPVIDPNNAGKAGAIFGDLTQIAQSVWQESLTVADQHNQPGKFTALVGWEWSSTPVGTNLHRVVLTPSSGKQAKQYLPFSSNDSQYPQDLWNWLEQTSQRLDLEFLAIPHNSNLSKGYMFAETTLKGVPITADYAQRRAQWEPVAEITQIKGDSETHPNISPNDEFSDFETYSFTPQQGDQKRDYPPNAAGYVRGALKTGLKLGNNIGVNPYKFGVIGSTDSHTGMASAEENNFMGKTAKDSFPANKLALRNGNPKNPSGWDMSASGLAAVWATDNTRQAIFDAFKRKEVYGTTGPRIKVRLFAGWGFSKLAADASNLVELGYSQGVPMGSDLLALTNNQQAPELLIHAIRDPKGANLDRVQVVKGWLDEQGNSQEKVYNVAWSGNRQLDENEHIAAVADTVNRKTGKVSNTIGTPELVTKWQDPHFDANQSAFYYVRVLQIPTARHSLLDAIALGIKPSNEWPETIQERAYTSPIWYSPK